jgi:DNA-binding response OmpR family regulator
VEVDNYVGKAGELWSRLPVDVWYKFSSRVDLSKTGDWQVLVYPEGNIRISYFGSEGLEVVINQALERVGENLSERQILNVIGGALKNADASLYAKSIFIQRGPVDFSTSVRVNLKDSSVEQYSVRLFINGKPFSAANPDLNKAFDQAVEIYLSTTLKQVAQADSTSTASSAVTGSNQSGQVINFQTKARAREAILLGVPENYTSRIQVNVDGAVAGDVVNLVNSLNSGGYFPFQFLINNFYSFIVPDISKAGTDLVLTVNQSPNFGDYISFTFETKTYQPGDSARELKVTELSRIQKLFQESLSGINQEIGNLTQTSYILNKNSASERDFSFEVMMPFPIIRPGETKTYSYSKFGPITIKPGYNIPEAEVILISAKDLKASDYLARGKTSSVEGAVYYLIDIEGNILPVKFGEERILGRKSVSLKDTSNPFNWISPGIAPNQVGIRVTSDGLVTIRDTVESGRSNGIKIAFTKSVASSAVTQDERGASKGTILVVDDSPEILEGLKAYLEWKNYTVITAENGQEAFDILKNRNDIHIQLVLSDVNMPVMTGDSLVNAMQENAMNVPVILHTLGEIVDLKKRFSENPGVMVIPKATGREILVHLEKVLGKSAAPSAASSPVVWAATNVDGDINKMIAELQQSNTFNGVDYKALEAYVRGEEPSKKINIKIRNTFDAFWLMLRYQLNVSSMEKLRELIPGYVLNGKHFSDLEGRRSLIKNNDEFLTDEEFTDLVWIAKVLDTRWDSIDNPNRYTQDYLIGLGSAIAIPSSSEGVNSEGAEKPTTPGGINFNPQLLDLQIKRDGNGIPLPIQMQPIPMIESQIQGIIPVIINITPITNLPLQLGIIDSPELLAVKEEEIAIN